MAYVYLYAGNPKTAEKSRENQKTIAMKKSVFKMAVVIMMIMAGPGTYAQRSQFTVCSCQSFSYGCTYVVMASVTACNSVPSCISIPVTHTITPGSCQGFAFTAPSGYTLNLSSASFQVTNLSNSVTATFGYSSAFTHSAGNCHGTGTGGGSEVTTWQGNGAGTYTVCADIITGMKPGGQASDPVNAKASSKEDFSVTGTENQALNIYPNPSSGAVTIGFAPEEQDDAELEIYNSFHEKVYSAKRQVNATGANKLQVDGLIPGIYVVVFKSGRETATYKFLVNP